MLSAKCASQFAGMIFQTCSRACLKNILSCSF
ncbi:MAG: DUF6783 domain-containing protein [Anaerobutyricum hallii]